jgi:exosortase
MTAESATTGRALAVPPKAEPTLAQLPLLAGALAAGLGLLVLVLFRERFQDLYEQWSKDKNYSHGFLVPVVSGYLAVRAWNRYGGPQQGAPLGGLAWIVGGTLVHFLALLVWLPPLDFLALAAILFGAAVMVGGRKWASRFQFPILFLFFMFPLPAPWINQMTIWLQDNVTTLSTYVLDLFIPTNRVGNFLHPLGQAPVEVGEACSGVRQMIAFVALACIVAHLSGRSLVFRALLLASAPVVAIVANLLRVLLMCVIVRYAGSKWISPNSHLDPWNSLSYHDAWGLLTMAVGLGLFLVIGWWLARIFPEDEPRRAPAPPASTPLGPGLVRRLAYVGAALLVAWGGQATLQAHLHNGQMSPPPKLQESLRTTIGGPNTSVPVSLGAWAEDETGLTKLPSSTLAYYESADDKLYLDFKYEGEGFRGLEARLWMIHFENGEDRKHHPAVCFKVAGDVEDPSGYAEFPVEEGSAPVRRFCFTGNRGSSYVFYWHYTLEPTAGPDVSALQRVYLKRIQKLPSVTVEVFTNARSEDDLGKVAEFCKQVHRKMRARLPSGARLGSDVLNIRLVETAPEPRDG